MFYTVNRTSGLFKPTETEHEENLGSCLVRRQLDINQLGCVTKVKS